ncbi:helix-hairpin-helix domain-containing protein [Filifactor alocis]|uniref:helix-hairpin-helix domain-containing protein n=1 Tax=Filifactor alocis TaxID=143361 RepID=UPI0028D25065|nr:helix-hairpin-helix domain-containing protein [Filifactor alocis]
MTSKFSKNKKYLFYIAVPIIIYALFQQTKQFYLPKTYPIPIEQQDLSVTTDTDTSTDDERQSNALDSLTTSNPTPVVIYVTGAVKSPGVVELNSNQRLKDAIELVGGFTEDADIGSINLAEFVKDEQHYVVTKIGETPPAQTVSSNTGTTTPNTANNNALININTATKEELKSLNGIGDALSQRIIDFREQNGAFSDIESIKNVSGIGEKKFEGIKDYITVQ